MQNTREISGLLVQAQHAFIALDLLPFKNEADRLKSKEIVKASMYSANSSHKTQTYGVNTVSVEDGLAYIHLGQWSPIITCNISKKLINRGVAHTITWNDSISRTQGGHHYRFNNLGDLVYRKTSKDNDCMFNGVELMKFANEHGAKALQAHIATLVGNEAVPSWDNQFINGDVFCAKYRKVLEQQSTNPWFVADHLHSHQFGLNSHYDVDSELLNTIKPTDRVLITVVGEEEFSVKLEVINVDADGIIEAELKSASWENDYNSVGDRIFLTKANIAAISIR